MIKATNSIAEKRLRNVPENKRFSHHNGKEINNLREFLAASTARIRKPVNLNEASIVPFLTPS